MQNNIIQYQKKVTPYQIFFIKNDLTLEVEELQEVNFEEIESHLERGESIFITKKQKHNSEPNFIEYEKVANEPWYFVRS